MLKWQRPRLECHICIICHLVPWLFVEQIMPRPTNTSEPNDRARIWSMARIQKHFQKMTRNAGGCIRVMVSMMKIWQKFDSTVSRGKLSNPMRRRLLVKRTHEGLGESIESASLGDHFGRDSTIAKLKPKYFWPEMWTDINNYINCERCQKNQQIWLSWGSAAQHTCASNPDATSRHWSVLIERIQWWICCCGYSTWLFHQIFVLRLPLKIKRHSLSAPSSSKKSLWSSNHSNKWSRMWIYKSGGSKTIPTVTDCKTKNLADLFHTQGKLELSYTGNPLTNWQVTKQSSHFHPHHHHKQFVPVGVNQPNTHLALPQGSALWSWMKCKLKFPTQKQPLVDAWRPFTHLPEPISAVARIHRQSGHPKSME